MRHLRAAPGRRHDRNRFIAVLNSVLFPVVGDDRSAISPVALGAFVEIKMPR